MAERVIVKDVKEEESVESSEADGVIEELRKRLVLNLEKRERYYWF